MIFELAQDFQDAVAAIPREHPRQRILRLLEEAIRRDIHFIARHPVTLFQCMWNTCWWYDCPEAEKYADSRTLKAFPQGPPWRRSGAKLSQVLANWLAEKSFSIPRFKWLRSLVPPVLGIGTRERFILKGHADRVARIAFTSDSNFLVSAGLDSIRTWDLRMGVEAGRVCQQPQVRAVGISSDGRIAAVSEKTCVRIIDAADGKQVRTLRCEMCAVLTIAISRDGNTVAVGGRTVQHRSTQHDSEHAGLHVWDLATGVTRLAVHDAGDLGPIRCMDLSSDGKSAVAVSEDGRLTIWDLASAISQSRFRTLGHGIEQVCFSPDNLTVAGCSHRGVRVWSAKTGETLQSFAEKVGASLLCYSADGRQLVTRASNVSDVLQFWDAHTGNEIRLLYGLGFDKAALGISPDGALVASASGDTVTVFDAQGEAQEPVYLGSLTTGLGIWFSHDGNNLTSECYADREERQCCTVRMRSVVSPHLFRDFKIPFEGPVICIAFTPDGHNMAVAAHFGLCMWDLRGTPSCVWTENEEGASVLQFSPDGRLLAVVGVMEDSLVLVDVLSGQKAPVQPTRHGGHVMAEHFSFPSFSPDGQTLSAVVDGPMNDESHGEELPQSRSEMRVWDLATGNVLETRLLSDETNTSFPGDHPQGFWNGLVTVATDETAVPQVGRPMPVSWHPSASGLVAHPRLALWAGSGLTLLTLVEADEAIGQLQ